MADSHVKHDALPPIKLTHLLLKVGQHVKSNSRHARHTSVWVLQGNGYGLGVLIAARAFLEGGMQEIGVGDLKEALALRRAGITAPIQVCYQPDLQSAAAIARAPDLQARPSPQTDRGTHCRLWSAVWCCHGEVQNRLLWFAVPLVFDRASKSIHREVCPPPDQTWALAKAE